MAERFIGAGTHRASHPGPTRKEIAEAYAHVNARDLASAPDRHGCRALDIDPESGPCSGRIERHHAGNKIGTKRVTSRYRVVCLCEGHHAHWAPPRNRMIVEWLSIHG